MIALPRRCFATDAARVAVFGPGSPAVPVIERHLRADPGPHVVGGLPEVGGRPGGRSELVTAHGRRSVGQGEARRSCSGMTRRLDPPPMPSNLTTRRATRMRDPVFRRRATTRGVDPNPTGRPGLPGHHPTHRRSLIARTGTSFRRRPRPPQFMLARVAAARPEAERARSPARTPTRSFVFPRRPRTAADRRIHGGSIGSVGPFHFSGSFVSSCPLRRSSTSCSIRVRD
ncbi:hypothetical protein STSO111631_15170 [Stackebrandtia soli]